MTTPILRETTTSQDPRKDSHRLPRGELQMAKAIHAKELLLQEKLWRVEEKIRQKIQKDGDQKSEEERHGRGQAEGGKAQTKTRLSEQQRREPVRSRDMIPQGRRQVDVKQLGKRQDQRNEDRTRSTHEEESHIWKGREMEVAQQQRKGHKVPHKLTGNEQKMNEELNKSRWENVKEHTRRKGGDEKDNGTWGKAGVKSHDDKGWTTEKKYKERTSEETDGSHSQQDMLQMSQEKSSHCAATENNRGAGRKLSGEPLLPPLSILSHPSRPEPEELITEHIDTSLQLILCRICNRKFSSDRLQKHSQICKKVKQSHRQAYNSYVHRTKGSANEEFLKTHSRARTPEVLKKKNPRQNQKANTRNLHDGKIPAEHPSEPKVSK
ncbi:golgin subfamily A member 6-like protein 26 [Pempheris klunzingeri]|uniref:golgin subfamily A member 6-like protein 26 n=1 Tax=Pempheris klunzingeri TaxID=3127111 RepID=UPI003980620E